MKNKMLIIYVFCSAACVSHLVTLADYAAYVPLGNYVSPSLIKP
jgi:hypothetical protein